MLLAPKTNHYSLLLGQTLVHGQGSGIIGLALSIQHLVQQKVARLAAAQTSDALHAGQFPDQALPLGDNLLAVAAHDGEALVADGGGGESAGWAGHVVGGLEVVEEACDGRGCKGRAEADAGQAEGLG